MGSNSGAPPPPASFFKSSSHQSTLKKNTNVSNSKSGTKQASTIAPPRSSVASSKTSSNTSKYSPPPASGPRPSTTNAKLGDQSRTVLEGYARLKTTGGNTANAHAPTSKALIGDEKRTILEGMASPSRIERDAKATTAPGSSQNKKTVYMPSHMDGTISSSSSISKQKSQTPQATPSNVMSKYDKSKTPTISASKIGPQPPSSSQYTPDSMLPPIPPSDSTYKLSASTTKAKSFLTTRHDQHMASRQTKIKSMREDERKEQEKWAQSYMTRIGICPQGFDWKAVDIFGGGYRCDGGHHIMTNGIIAEGQGGVYLWVDPEDHPEDIYGPYYPDEDSPGWVKYCGPEPKDRYAPDKFKTESGSGAPTSGKSIRIPAHVESRLKSKTLPTASSMQREASRSEYAGGRSNNTLTQSLRSSRHPGASSIAPPPPPSSSRAGYYTPQGFVSQQPPINSSSRSDEERRARRAESDKRGG